MTLNSASERASLAWGRLVRWEDYEDTERVAAWDEQRAADTNGPA